MAAGLTAPVDNTAYAAFLKKLYIGKRALFQLDSYKTPLLGMVQKGLWGMGSTWEQTVGVTNVQGGSAVYANAYANSTAGVDKVFSGNFKKRYADVKIDHFTIASSRGEEGAVEKVLKRKVDSLKDEYMQAINAALYKDEGGSLCQLAPVTGALAVFNGAVSATDSTKAGVQFIKPGKTINMGPNLDGTLLCSGLTAGTPAKAQVVGRNVFAGTFTYTAGDVQSHPSGSAYIFEDGTAGSSLCGLPSWCPLTDTLAATTFKGVDRSIDVNGLGGIRISGVGDSIEELLNDAVAAHRQMGGDPDAVLIHPKKFALLKKEMSGRIRYVETKGKPLVGGSNSFSFRGLEIDGNGRPVVVYEDAACPTAVTWMIDTKTMTLLSMGTLPMVPEGVPMLQQIIGTSLFQSQLFGYPEFVSARPSSILAICHDTSIT